MLMLSLFFTAYSFSAAQKLNSDRPFNRKDSIHISGKIIGYQTSQEEHFITFSTYNLSGKQTNQAIQIEDDGSFYIKLFQPFDGDIQMAYKDNYIDIYVKAGSPLEMTIDNKKIEKSSADAIHFNGDQQISEVNTLIYQFQAILKNHTFKISPNMGDKKQGDSLYTASVRGKLDEELHLLHEFIEKRAVKNQIFIAWQTQHLKYTAGNYILFYPFAGKFNKEINQKQLLGLISTIPINAPEAFNNSAYYSFLKALCGDQEIMVNINPDYVELKKVAKNNTIVYLNEIDRFVTGLTKQLCYYYFYPTAKIEESNGLTSRFDQVIQHPFLRAVLHTNNAPILDNFASYSILTRLKAFNIRQDLKNRLLSIFARYEGKNLYIDFWGDWCGPCMSEMSNYPKLINAIKEKPVQFIFFSTFTTEANMLAIKEKYHINAIFINLNKDETAIMNNAFDFHSYPSHFLVDHKGIVIGKGSSLGRAEDIQSSIEHLKNKFKW